MSEFIKKGVYCCKIDLLPTNIVEELRKANIPHPNPAGTITQELHHQVPETIKGVEFITTVEKLYRNLPGMVRQIRNVANLSEYEPTPGFVSPESFYPGPIETLKVEYDANLDK